MTINHRDSHRAMNELASALIMGAVVQGVRLDDGAYLFGAWCGRKGEMRRGTGRDSNPATALVAALRALDDNRLAYAMADAEREAEREGAQ